MNRKIRTAGMAVGVAVLITGAVVYLKQDPKTIHQATAIEPAPEALKSQSGDRQSRRPENAFANGASENQITFEEFAAQSIRERFGKTISKKSHYANLMRFRDYLMAHYPENWNAMLVDIVRRAFPDLADEILKTLSLLDEYNDWLEYSNEMLSEMSYQEMKNAMRSKRTEIFGEDAAGRIWEGETGIDHVRDTLSILREAYTTTIEEKLKLYTSALVEVHQEDMEGFLRDDRYSYLGAFLNMESVQDELKQMSPVERAQTLRKIRREMGYGEKAIEEMQELDAYRERRWENGLNYMRDREKIIQNFDGEELEEKLRALRERYFRHEASTIEAEEASGFFRFRRRRVYGRN